MPPDVRIPAENIGDSRYGTIIVECVVGEEPASFELTYIFNTDIFVFEKRYNVQNIISKRLCNLKYACLELAIMSYPSCEMTHFDDFLIMQLSTPPTFQIH